MVTPAVSSSIPPPDNVDRFEKAAAEAAKERPRWKSEYKGPDPGRQKIDGKAVVSREELADFRKRFGANKTLRDLLNADATGKLPPPVATSSGRGKAEGRRAEDDVVYKPRKPSEQEMRAHMAEMSRPGRDAIEPTLGPEVGVAGLGRLAVKEGLKALPRAASAVRDAIAQRATGSGGSVRPDLRKEFEAFRRGDEAGMQQARAAREAAEEAARARTRSTSPGRASESQREPVVDLAPQGRVFRSARPDAEAAKQAEYMRRVEELGLKKGGSTKSYAKGGSVRGAGCESRTKKTRYI
jgi:hypothetical protein